MDRGTIDILQGDLFATLPGVAAETMQCCVTSPPYFALRSYLPTGHESKHLEIGSEPTPEAFIATMVAVFREVRRVLHPTGTLFVNLGDSYAATQGGRQSAIGELPKRGGKVVGSAGWNGNARGADTTSVLLDGTSGVRGGELLNIPHRVAEALRADGWIWRQTILWAKPSPMPESIRGWQWERCRVKVLKKSVPLQGCALAANAGRGSQAQYSNGGVAGNNRAAWSPCPGCPKCDPHGGWVLRRGKGRCTTAHEYVFVFAKSAGYFWDSAAFVEKATQPRGESRQTHQHKQHALRQNTTGTLGANHGPETRNPRSVWTISAEPSSDKHFASYPSELVRRCIQAGTSDGGCCPTCRAPFAPMVERRTVDRERPNDRTSRHEAGNGTNSCGNTVAGVSTTIHGYRATCGCGGEPVPCRVLDPFGGTGTTGQVASWMGRDAVLCELNPEYVEIIKRKVAVEPRCLVKRRNGTKAKPAPKILPGQKAFAFAE